MENEKLNDLEQENQPVPVEETPPEPVPGEEISEAAPAAVEIPGEAPPVEEIVPPAASPEEAAVEEVASPEEIPVEPTPAEAPVAEIPAEPVSEEAAVSEPIEDAASPVENPPEEAVVEEMPAAEQAAEVTGQSWTEQFLNAPTAETAILPDAHALQLGLSHPADAEVDQIIQEAKDSDWNTADLGITQIVAQIKAEEAGQEAAPLTDEAVSQPASQPEEPAMPVAETPFRDAEYREAFGEGEGLQEIFGEAPAAPMEEIPQPPVQPAEETPKPRKKIRPRMKKGYGLFGLPHLAVTAVWLAIVLLIGVTLGRMVWLAAADVLAFGREDKKVVITITETDTIDSIATKLKKAGLIEYPELFKIYADLAKADQKISAGTFEVFSRYDYHALVNALTPYSPDRQVVEVVIPEGYNCRQIFRLLEEQGVCDAQALADYAANGELAEYWFLEGVERGEENCLEGFLFPDTYEFYTSDSPRRVLEKMLDDFDYRFTEKMMGDLETLNQRFAKMLAKNGFDQAYIDAHPITIQEVVIVASILQRETSSNAESYTISSVIYNRLANPNKYPTLNIDSTLVYALGRSDLTDEDRLLDNPYNTHLKEGLPPGAIANPGIHALYAALDPDESNWYYYAWDPEENEHRFFRYGDDYNWFIANREDY